MGILISWMIPCFFKISWRARGSDMVSMSELLKDDVSWYCGKMKVMSKEMRYDGKI